VFTTNKLTVAAVCFLTCLFASFALAKAPTSPPDLQSADWSVKQAKVLNAEPNETVWKFINQLWGGTDDLDAGSGEVCQFKFADLRHSGQLSLVVSYDNGGRAVCNMINIFDKSPAGISRYDFNANAGQDFSFDSVEDINGDGHHELIVDTAFAGGGGIDHCIATWPVVYAWNGIIVADVSTESKGYYRKTLARLNRQIATQSLPPPASEQETTEGELMGSNGARVRVRIIRPRAVPAPPPDAATDTDCLKAEAGKIQRFLATRDAGMSDAIKWANSSDPHDRVFAIYILGDIGTPKAIRYVRTLSKDPDRNVAMSAKNFLTHASNGSVANPTIQGSAVP